MDDTISRQAAIDACLKGKTDGLPATNVACDCCAERIRVLPYAQQEPHWIPCSERMPDEETDVLVTRTFLGCKDGSHGWNAHIPPTKYVEVARYFDGEWTALSDEYKVARSRHTNPVAWMPLPEPYEDEQT